MLKRKRCLGCQELYRPRPQVPNQKYCSKPECQRQRRNAGQRRRRARDKDHCANDRESRQCWREKRPGYWKEYRSKRPEYVARNREQQKERNKRRHKAKPVKKAGQTETSRTSVLIDGMRLHLIFERQRPGKALKKEKIKQSRGVRRSDCKGSRVNGGTYW